MLRIFLGIAIPENIKKSLSALQGGIPGARWVPEENYHITLQFIGEVSEDKKEDIAEALESIEFPCFDLSLFGLDSFSIGEKPHHLFIKLMPEKPLIALNRKINHLLKTTLKVKLEERKYTPHLTIAHLKNPNINKVGQFMGWHNLFHSPTFKVSEYILYHSFLTHHGPTYKALDIFSLDEEL